MSDYTTIPIKVCSKCQRLLPATTFFFHNHKEGKYGLTPSCKACIAEQTKQYRAANVEKLYEQRKQYRANNAEKIANAKRQYAQENREKIAEKRKKFYQENRENILAKVTAYRRSNPELIKTRKQKYYQKNRDRILEEQRQYHLENPNVRRVYHLRNRDTRNRQTRMYYALNRDMRLMYAKQYRQTNREKILIRNHQYRARKRGLPDTFTSEQWIYCLEYFNYCCAVCGKQLRDLFGDIIPNADHWLPLASPECLGTVAENMICLCNECNNSKYNKLPEIWLTEKYSKRKAQEILARIQTYFASLT